MSGIDENLLTNFVGTTVHQDEFVNVALEGTEGHSAVAAGATIASANYCYDCYCSTLKKALVIFSNKRTMLISKEDGGGSGGGGGDSSTDSSEKVQAVVVAEMMFPLAKN